MIDEDHVGQASQSARQAHDLYGQIVDQVRQMTAAKPMGALIAAMGIGFAFGLLSPRR